MHALNFLTALLIALKLTAWTDLSWWIVFAPTLIYIFVWVIIIGGIITFFSWFIK